MYLKKISIKNFRAFDDVGLDVIFKKGVNAIIGENNNGKSALIDAIRIAFSVLQYRKDIYFNKSDFHINSLGERAGTVEMDVYLEDVPKYLIEIWNPEGNTTTGEFHLRFYLDTTPSGVEKIKYKAWGGKIEGNTLSTDTFDAMNIAFLGALRDAENEMKPSRSSKLANLLNTLTTSHNEKQEIVEKLLKANNDILNMEPIKKTKDIINANLSDIEQELLHQQVDVGLVEPRFESVTSSLRSWIVPRWYFIKNDSPLYQKLLLDCEKETLNKLIHACDGGMYFDINGFLRNKPNINEAEKESLLALMNHSFELSQNGLGYNNLLFMSTVLGDMSEDKKGILLNLFAIEEPEAHLHPQLQELIHNFFERRHQKSSSIQVIYTSHSPTLVSRIGTDAINLLFEDNHSMRCYPLASALLNAEEKDHLQKYLDVTKSQIFFAKGIIFVEGMSEALLISEMARLLNRSLDKYAVEIVNIDGTSFKPFVKLLTLPSGDKSFVKAAVVTDDDRCTDKSDISTYISKDLDFDSDMTNLNEKLEKGKPSDRFNNISKLCSNKVINVFGAKKTFEYELSLHENNVSHMLDAIRKVHPIVGKNLKELVEKESNLDIKALMIWLFIRTREKSKAEIAQELCRALQAQIKAINKGVITEKLFIVPEYIADAIYSVTEPLE